MSPSRHRLDNLALAAWLLVEAVSALRFASSGDDLATGLLGLAFVLAAWWSARRGPPRGVDARPVTWAVVIAGVGVAYGYDHDPFAVLDGNARALQWAGAALVLWAVAHLRTSFSVLPQARNVVASGPYAWIRHPMYLGYLLFDLSHCIATPTIHNATVWMLEAIFLGWRAVLERRCLAENLRRD